MNEFAKTGVIVGGAVLLAVIASTMGPREVKNDLFSDQGEVFFASFTDPANAVDLEVTEFNADKAEARKFAVRRDKDGRWTIPSHGGYPADAKDRMGKAAAMWIGLRKERCVGEHKGDEIACGVVDPLDPGADPAGRGTRVTMKDSAGNVLADVIVGKEVENKMGVRYLRLPGKRRVYAAKLDGELSTKFADWIETDLLKAQQWDIAKVTFDNYSVDEQRGEIVPGDKYVVTKGADNKWQVEGLDAAKEQPNEEKLNEIGTTLSQIKIVDVRSKPEGLTGMLEQATGFDRARLAASLQDKGFFLDRRGKLHSNEGDLLFETKKGVRYTLRFGELVGAGGEEATTVGGDKPADAAAPAKPADNRYLMVTAEFVEDLVPEPAGARLPKAQVEKRAAARAEVERIVQAVEAYRAKNDGKLPATLAELTVKPAEGEPLLASLAKDPWEHDYVLSPEGEGFAVVSYGDDGKDGGEGAATDVRSDRIAYEEALAREARAWDDHDKKLEDGRAEAAKLMRRFGPWYYVIDRTMFEKLKPKREDLVQPKVEKSEEAPVAPGDADK